MNERLISTLKFCWTTSGYYLVSKDKRTGWYKLWTAMNAEKRSTCSKPVKEHTDVRRRSNRKRKLPALKGTQGAKKWR